MNPTDVLAFAERDWQRVARLETEFWTDRKRTLGLLEAFRLGDELRRQVIACRAEWPTEQSKDLSTHSRVAETLGAVDPSRAR